MPCHGVASRFRVPGRLLAAATTVQLERYWKERARPQSRFTGAVQAPSQPTGQRCGKIAP
eukprot:1168074-Rhodomonas_salina.1